LIYLSRSRGEVWEKKSEEMKYSAEFERLAFEKVGVVTHIFQNKIDPE
jgi:hypothetical protein